MSKVVTGARLELRIGAVVVAYASNVQYSWNYEMIPIKGIDDIVVKENAEVGATVTFSASMFRVVHETAVKHGWMPKLDKLLQQPELIAIITDLTYGRKGASILTVTGLKCTGRSGTVDARGVFTETLTFVGKEIYDEEG